MAFSPQPQKGSGLFHANPLVTSVRIFIFATQLHIFMEASDLLQKNGLSRTRNRLNILDVLSHAPKPLSVKEIGGLITVHCDKSTVHRTLNSLFDKQIVQRIIVDHEVKYALGKKYNGKKGHKGDHVHFKCSACDTLFCLEEIEVMDYTLPEGFVKEENQFLVIGRCSRCKK